jgi:HSP20 family protein
MKPMTSDAIQKTSRPIEVTRGQAPRSSWTYRPNVDIFDGAEELLLVADLPGADPERIDVSLESGILTLQAEVLPRHPAQARCLAHEYGVGGFHRRFEIDESVEPEAVTADYRDGTLTIHLPKAPQAKRRRIPVSS